MKKKDEKPKARATKPSTPTRAKLEKERAATRGAGAKKGRGSRATRSSAPIADLVAGLDALYPDAECELDFGSPFQLLVATILSAQCTDKVVNTVTPALFARFADAAALAAADVGEVERLVARTGFFRQKAKNIVATARRLVEEDGGEVPREMARLVTLPGVARKTANVVLGTAYGMNEGFVVDTHIGRIAGRLGLTKEADPKKIEQDLMAVMPRALWTRLGHQIIWHGRRVCQARKPACERCGLAALCPSAGEGAGFVRVGPSKQK